ncbi:MAG: hypothetical protein OEZ43_10505 [Gammaproteobacteria bacterium]|nr:hypothetical protein [Gammaproteobacteria bacterium]
MGVYSTDKLITEARRLAAEYRRATGKPLGISSEIAEFDAAKLLDLEICDQKTGGYDAIGRGKRQGKKVQIKGRAVFDEKKSGQRVGQLKLDQDWDSIVLVIMDEEYEPVEIFECARSVVEKSLDESKSSKRNKRGAMSLAKFKIVSDLVWTKEEGLIEGGNWEKEASV